MRARRTFIYTVLAVVSCFVLVGCLGNAEEPPPDPDRLRTKQDTSVQRSRPFGTEMTEPPSYFSAAQIEAAGRIFAKVQKKKRELQQKDDTSSVEEAIEIQQKIREVRRAAVSNEPTLTPDQMQYLLHRAKWDRELRKKFFQAIREAGETPPNPFSPTEANGSEE